MFSKMTTFDSLLEAVPDALLGMGQKGVIRFVNHQTELMFGYDRDELVGQPIETLMPEHLGRICAEHREDYFADVRTASAGIDLEPTGRHRDGTEFPVNVGMSHIDTGDVLMVITAVADATRQRQAVKNAQHITAIVKYSNDAIIGCALAGIVTSWNPAAERIYGYSSQEMVGRSARHLTPLDRTAESEEVLAKIEAGQHVEHLATKRIRKDGSVFPVSLTVSPIRDPDGTIVGTSVIHRDMTELEHAALYARSLIEAGLDPLVTISPEGKITDVNQASVTITGVSRDALVGTDFTQYVTDPAKAQEGYERAFEQGWLTDYPLTLLHRDGTETDVLCNVSIYRDFNGSVLGVLAVARDASLLRQQQQLSVQLQEALNSRVVIEQAKGITAHRHAVTIEQAYQLIRAHARNNNASLRTVAMAIVEVGLRV
jgi:PAS domain S-box-containing protein